MGGTAEGDLIDQMLTISPNLSMHGFEIVDDAFHKLQIKFSTLDGIHIHHMGWGDD